MRRLRRNADVLLDRERTENPTVLRNPSESPRRDAVRRAPVDPLILKRDRPSAQLHDAHDRLERRALPRAVASHQAHDLASLIGKREPAMGVRGLPETEIIFDNLEVAEDTRWLCAGECGKVIARQSPFSGSLPVAPNAQALPPAAPRLGIVYEARGAHRQVADCYCKVIDVIRANPDDYDPGFEAVFHKFVDRLDSPAAT